MGREVRRVPPNWQHPKKERYDYPSGRTVEDYQSMHDEPFGPAMDKWYAEWKLWEAGQHPDQLSGSAEAGTTFWDWYGNPPDPEYYRPAWPEGSATWWQMYQTVSEGSPVTPPFATPEELVDYLVANGDEWDQKRGNGGWDRKNAEAFVKSGWAPSLTVIGGVVREPRDGLPANGGAVAPSRGESQE